MSIEMIDASGLFRDRVKVCAPTPQPASRTRLPAGVGGIGVKQLDKGGGLILQAPAFPWIVAVNVCFVHAGLFYLGSVIILAVGSSIGSSLILFMCYMIKRRYDI